MKNYIFYFPILFFLSLSCKEKKEIEGFNTSAWSLGKMGCEGQRSEQVNLILNNKKEWLGLDDDEIVELLGRPERSYYYERNVRAFGYYLATGKQCDINQGKFGKRIVVEFNATGFSKRIFLEE